MQKTTLPLIAVLAILASAGMVSAKTITILSDYTWKGSTTEQIGWNDTGFDDSGWGYVTSGTEPKRSWFLSTCLGNTSATGIWYNNCGNCERYLRKTFNINESIISANLSIAVDDYYELYINGQKVGNGTWGKAYCYDIRSYLQQGENVIAVRVVNYGANDGLWLESTIETTITRTLYIHAPGKQCINSPLYVQITDYNNTPIANAQVMFNLGTDFGPYTSDSNGYVSAFTPESTGTLTITAGSGNQTATATVEVINSSLCGQSTCQKCPSSEAKGKVSIKDFKTDKTSYSTGKVIKMTATLENSENCNYPIYANVNTLTPNGKPFFSMGYNVTVESGVNTLSFEAYVPGIAEKGTYNLNFFWKTEKSDLLPVGSKTIQVTIQ